MEPGAPPFIVSLKLDPDSFARLDALRQTHFPAERNFLDAHLTLFHMRPVEDAAERQPSSFRACGPEGGDFRL